MGGGVVVGGNLQQLGRVGQAMDFIKNDAAPAQAAKKALGVQQHPTDAGKFTVEVLGFAQGLAEVRLSHAPNPRQPYDGARPPGAFKEIEPITPLHHMQV